MATKKATTKITRAKSATPKANKKAKAKKLSQIEAAVKVLEHADEPMTCKELVAAMAKKGLWQSPGRKTPDQTLYASILRDLKKGKNARFQKAAPSKFTLAKKK